MSNPVVSKVVEPILAAPALAAIERVVNTSWLNAYGERHEELRRRISQIPPVLWRSSPFVRALIHLLKQARSTRLCVDVLERSLAATAPKISTWQARLLYQQHAYLVLLDACRDRSADELATDSASLLKWVARAALAEREYARAVELLRVYVKTPGEARAGKVWLAHALLGAGQVQEALAVIDKHLVDWPRDRDAAGVERQILVAKGGA